MDRFFYHKGRRLGLLSLGGYEIPILYPLPTGTWFQPRYVVVISHTRDNCFGLYGYPADELKYNLHLDVEHQSVKGIVTPYL
jgi:hypothetical protein